jgi:4-aminobutyrate aminotransferase-like enzyme
MGNVLTLTPPLIIGETEMDQALDLLDDAIGEVEAGDPA